MRKVLLTLLAVIPLMVNAQVGMVGSAAQTTTDKITFEKLSLTDAVARAKKENKPIYVDLSATWCGPCQQMKKTTFVCPPVVEFMNANFINICFECDIDEKLSKEYTTKYKSTAFPTHLIIDAKGELIHKFVGALEPRPFIEELEKGVVTDKSLKTFNSRHAAGERSPEFVAEYIGVLQRANETEVATGLANEYLSGLPVEKLTEKETFTIVNEFVRDMDSDVAKKIIANEELFVKNIGQQDYKMYIYMLWSIKAHSYVKEIDGQMTYDKAGYKQCMKQLKSSGFEHADDIAMVTAALNAKTMQDWNEFLKITSRYMQQNGAKANLMTTCNWAMDVQRDCTDQKVRQKFADILYQNFLTVKQTGSEDAKMWEESVNAMVADLKREL